MTKTTMSLRIPNGGRRKWRVWRLQIIASCASKLVCSIFQMKIISSSSKRPNLCLNSRVPISLCTHPCLATSAQITRVFTVFASKRRFKWFQCFNKYRIHLQHESSVKHWRCWAFLPVRVRQANVSQFPTVRPLNRRASHVINCSVQVFNHSNWAKLPSTGCNSQVKNCFL